MPPSPVENPARRSLLLLGGFAAGGMLAGCAAIQQQNREPTEEPSSEPSPEPERDMPKKPVLYLYPTRTMDLSVSLDYEGTLTYTYPTPQARADGSVTWQVTAAPDGDLTDASGRHYPSLFWEGEGTTILTQDEGFVVEADAAAAFLEDKLSTLGLSEREAAEFITFWGPRIAERGRALVTFASEEFARQAIYRFTDPSSGAEIVPDTFIRVYIVVGDAPQTAVREQKLVPAPARTGFTAVEWGGTER
ncbi:transcriptional initiation protein Tat [Actinomyces oris]|uniref:transcriptional initiation protein Tat n=1 Tax=Actinomyces TaxID=1654 RepID=UPI00094CB81F|nr:MULTISPECIES: transcriptional initiation protein Tat [Actinomyces]OLO61226.1 transcriptional initiation protein Tat [Actinomyces oris]